MKSPKRALCIVIANFAAARARMHLRALEYRNAPLR